MDGIKEIVLLEFKENLEAVLIFDFPLEVLDQSACEVKLDLFLT